MLIVIMSNGLQIFSITIFFVVFMILINSNAAWSDSDKDKDYCYDQVGDGHFCFNTKEKCRHEQNSDNIAESPCYNKDRM
jgi:hypothetical protein